MEVRAAAGAGENSDHDTPSELLAPLLEEWREVLVKHVLARLDPTDCVMLALVAKPWLAVVLANKLPRAGQKGAVKLELEDFVGSAAMLAWAKANGCPWVARVCSLAAEGGHLEALQWARENDCPWNSSVCYTAAGWGHLEVLQWALGQECPFDEDELCAAAIDGGDPEMCDWMEEEGFFPEDYF